MKKDLGLTLLEVLVAMGIAAIAGALLLAVMVNSTGLFYSQGSKVEQGVDANDALTEIRSVVRQSSAVASGYPVSNPTHTSGVGKLVLKLASIDGSGNIIPDTFDYYVFLKDQNLLRVRSFPDALSSITAVDEVLANNVNTIRFDYYDGSGGVVIPTLAAKVKATITLRQKAGSYFEASIATAEASLLND